MGIDSVEDDKFCYRAVLEITSYFWASKGGRGTLLEKLIASLGNSYSFSNVTLSKILSIASTNVRNTSVKLNFDLMNIIDDRLIILEVKNRVDSGGTAAREESLGKKFLTICRTIENEDKIFSYQCKEIMILQNC